MRDLVVFSLTILAAGCGSLGKKTRPDKLVVDRPILLELSGSLARDEQIRYFFASSEQRQTGTDKPASKNESVEFLVKTTTNEVFPNGEVGYLVQTLSKKGDVGLHDLAFPEQGERLDEILTRSGRVLKAGEYSPESIFFLPPIPLPLEPVRVGETWNMKHRWASDTSGLPLELDLVTILKAVYSCGQDDQCADLEISGQVSLPQQVPGLTLESEIEGHMLYAMKYGSIVWSEIRTREKVNSDQTKAIVNSCLKSQIEKPDGYQWKWDAKLVCDPQSAYENVVPGILAEK